MPDCMFSNTWNQLGSHVSLEIKLLSCLFHSFFLKKGNYRSIKENLLIGPKRPAENLKLVVPSAYVTSKIFFKM